MRDRLEQILRIACLALVALVLAQLVHAVFQVSQLAGVKIPAMPTLETKTNSIVTSASQIKTQTTNLPEVVTAKTKTSISTGAVTVQPTAGTNSIATSVAGQITTNSLAAGTNPAASSNPPTVAKIGTTNSSGDALTKIPAQVSTNLAASQKCKGSNSISTNVVARLTASGHSVEETNFAGAGTNKISEKNLPSPAVLAGGMNFGRPMMSGMVRMAGMPGMAGPPPPLPPGIQAEVDKIVSSEIFGPVPHPLPEALLGIAGDTAFLRTASGQTGLVDVGDSLGDLKLLQIGVNRVLVEENGEKKELMIFEGFGGDSLLPKQDKTQNDHDQSQMRAR